jgi:ABC-2 type transport system ATP-binding protein
MAPPLVQTRSLTKRYGDITALEDCNLEVPRGEIFGLLGPNGSGKTTLIRLLMGFLEPTVGTATIDGLDCYRHPVDVHQRVAYVPGDVRLFPRMRGRDVLRFFNDVRQGGNFSRALELADRLELDLSRQVAFCSTGMRQKLALASCFSVQAALMILDEPTSNLDPTVRGDVLNLVREARDAGSTILFSSHVLSEVEAISDHVIILRKGRTVHTQQMSELRRQHRIRAQLTGQLPQVPDELRDQLTIRRGPNGQLTIETPGELSPLLGWLAQAPLAEVHIEPIGLLTVYERFHPVATL